MKEFAEILAESKKVFCDPTATVPENALQSPHPRMYTLMNSGSEAPPSMSNSFGEGAGGEKSKEDKGVEEELESEDPEMPKEVRVCQAAPYDAIIQHVSNSSQPHAPKNLLTIDTAPPSELKGRHKFMARFENHTSKEMTRRVTLSSQRTILKQGRGGQVRGDCVTLKEVRAAS